MSTQTQIVINCDEENNAGDWWTAALAADKTGLPASCVGLVHGTTDRVTVSAEDAELFRAWGSSLPGWANGPSYAAEPFVFNPAE
jgi:hypothetical protein